jgi:hypothetical protein
MREVYSRSRHPEGNKKTPQLLSALPLYGNRQAPSVFFYQRPWQSTMIHVVEAVLEGCVNSKMTTATLGSSFGQLRKEPSKEQEPLDPFDRWFSRCRNTLHFMANLILNSPELAEHAVQKCRQKALGNPPKFENEGEFNGWIFRLLVDEALVIRSGRCKAFWG